mgnify:CR=1 FL=1
MKHCFLIRKPSIYPNIVYCHLSHLTKGALCVHVLSLNMLFYFIKTEHTISTRLIMNLWWKLSSHRSNIKAIVHWNGSICLMTMLHFIKILFGHVSSPECVRLSIKCCRGSIVMWMTVMNKKSFSKLTIRERKELEKWVLIKLSEISKVFT